MSCADPRANSARPGICNLLSIERRLSRFETETLMRISASTGTGLGLGPRNAAAEPRGNAGEPLRAALPALVPQEGRFRDSDPDRRVRAVATLLAQLVAGAEDLPATRVKRRADPESGAECYRAIARLGAAKAPAKVRVI